MNVRPDPDGLVRTFLKEGPTELSTRVIAGIRDDVVHIDQRAAHRPGRETVVPRSLLLVAAPLVAVMLVAAVALFAPGGDETAKPHPTSAPVVAPPESAAPVATATLESAPPSSAVAATETPSPSPDPVLDGEPWILFERAGEQGDEIALIRPDASGEHQIGAGNALEQRDARWSPDGREIVFVADNGNYAGVWVMNHDSTEARSLTPLDDRCSGVCPFAHEPAWSPDGASIAYIESMVDLRRSVQSSLRIIDLGSGDIQTVYTTTDETLHDPSWSPDGRRIAVGIDRFTGLVDTSDLAGRAIGVIDLDAAKPKPTVISDWSLFAIDPAWHPSQDLILFGIDVDDSADTTQAPTFQTVHPDGSGMTVVTPFPIATEAGEASWLPDGSRIAFTLKTGWPDQTSLATVGSNGSDHDWTTGGQRIYGADPRWRPIP